jgi:hypothetical protein
MFGFRAVPGQNCGRNLSIGMIAPDLISISEISVLEISDCHD